MSSEQGALWIDDLRREDGRWIVPGAVAIFTSRGQKVVDVGIGDKLLGGFLIPLAGLPSRDDLEWTTWYPQAREGDAPLPDQFTYRYRVVRQSDSVRTAAIGPFAIDSRIAGFYSIVESERLAANTEFTVRYQGQPVAGLERVTEVAAVGGAAPALFVRAEDESQSSSCYLVAVRDGALAKEAAPECADPSDATPLTNEVATFTASRKRVDLPGWIDRETLAQPGMYLIGGTILDTRNLTMRAVNPRRSFRRNAQRQRAAARDLARRAKHRVVGRDLRRPATNRRHGHDGRQARDPARRSSAHAVRQFRSPGSGVAAAPLHLDARRRRWVSADGA